MRAGNQPSDYLTDVLAAKAVDFVKQSAGQPFAIEVATFSPHAPYTPAPRDANAFPDLRAPRTPAFNAAPDAAAPQWLRTHPALTDADMAGIDRDFRKRAQSVQAVDKMIGELQEAVAAIGEANNTYFVFSSDNGYHMGEHRMMPGKMTAFDTDIHVPLIVTGPGIAPGRVVQEIADNIDLNPTFTEIGGAATARQCGRPQPGAAAARAGGRRMAQGRAGRAPWPPHGRADPDFPGKRGGNPPSYEAIRGADLGLCRIRRRREGILRPRHRSGRAAQHLCVAARRPEGIAARHADGLAELPRCAKLRGRRRLRPQHGAQIAARSACDLASPARIRAGGASVCIFRRAPARSRPRWFAPAPWAAAACTGLRPRRPPRPSDEKSGMVGQRPPNMKPDTAMTGVAGLC